MLIARGGAAGYSVCNPLAQLTQVARVKRVLEQRGGEAVQLRARPRTFGAGVDSIASITFPFSIAIRTFCLFTTA